MGGDKHLGPRRAENERPISTAGLAVLPSLCCLSPSQRAQPKASTPAMSNPWPREAGGRTDRRRPSPGR